MALLTVDRLVLGYGTRVVAENISFTVEKGDYLCIVGENGSGKTTLMKTLLGLQAPLDGEIRAGDGLERIGIGYLPQQTEVQKDFPASVEEVVLSGCQARCGLRPFYNRKEKMLAQSNMKRMGIGHLRKRCYRELSGGQQQRVLLARALCATRSLLLLDEPVSGLDPKATDQMYRIIAELNREGITIIMISHDIRAAMEYAQKVLYVGPDIFFGTKEEFLRSGAGRSLSLREGEGPAPAGGTESFPRGRDGSCPADGAGPVSAGRAEPAPAGGKRPGFRGEEKRND